MYDFLFSFLFFFSVFSVVFSFVFLFFVSFFIFFSGYEDGPETAVVTGALEELGRESKLGTGGGGRITATIAVFLPFFLCGADNLKGGAVERAGRGQRGRGRGAGGANGGPEGRGRTFFIRMVFFFDTTRSDGGGCMVVMAFLYIQSTMLRMTRPTIITTKSRKAKMATSRTLVVGQKVNMT